MSQMGDAISMCCCHVVSGMARAHTHHRYQMKLIHLIAAAAAVLSASFVASVPANAEVSICKYEGVPQARCRIQHMRVRSGWKDEVLIDPDGTTRRISREIRGEAVQINLYLPGQSKGSFHQGTYRLSGPTAKISTDDGGSYLSHGNKVIIYVDGGKFSYTL